MRHQRHVSFLHLRFASARALAVAAVSVALGGCGGVSQREAAVPSAFLAADAPTAPARGFVRIERVENRTGRPECDDLAHYVHLKTAQMLDAAGWSVVSDDLLSRADFLGLGDVEPDALATNSHALRVEILRAQEQAGATVSLAVFSTQRQTAAVALRLRWRDEATGAERTLDGRGASAKGAWGVLAKVDREALLRREGFWQLDRSLIGGAATDALTRIFSESAK